MSGSTVPDCCSSQAVLLITKDRVKEKKVIQRKKTTGWPYYKEKKVLVKNICLDISYIYCLAWWKSEKVSVPTIIFPFTHDL